MKILLVGEPEIQPILLRMREHLHCDVVPCSVVVLDRVSSTISEHFPPRIDLHLDQFIKAAEDIRIGPCEIEKPRKVFPHATEIKQFAKSQCEKVVKTFRRNR